MPAAAGLDLSAVFDALPGCYLVLSADPGFSIVAASAAWLDLTNTVPGEIIGRPLFDVFPRDQAMDGGLHESFERVLRHRAADVLPVWRSAASLPGPETGAVNERHWAVSNTPVFGTDGTLAYIIHRTEDVTGNQHAQDALQDEALRLAEQVDAANRALAVATREADQAADQQKRSEERFAAAFRLAPVPMIVSRLDGFRILDVNEAFTAAFGYYPIDAAGRTADDLKLWDQSAARQRAEQALLMTGRLRSFDARLVTRTGWRLDCLVSAEIVTIDGQRCSLAVLQDITERKRSEAELASAIEAVLRDTSWFSHSIIEKLAQLRHPERGLAGGATLADLTPRERDVLGLLCRGLTGDTMAERLGLSRNTVRNHLAGLYGKLGVNGRSDAIIWARDRGFSGEPGQSSPR